MEHLPIASGLEPVSVDIPLFCNPYDFDHKEFSEYPSRTGWELNPDESVPTRVDGATVNLQDIKAFLQTWLFFGMLGEVFTVCEARFAPNDFIRDEKDGRFITTAMLPKYLDQWANKVKELSQSLRKVRYSRIASCLRAGTEWILKLDPGLGTYGADRDRSASDLLFSLQVLEETLENSMNVIWGLKEQETLLADEFWANFISHPGLELRNLWCRSEKSMISGHFNSSSLWFASTILRNYGDLDHSACTSNHCAARQIDDSSYETRHVSDNCHCTHVSVNTGELWVVLREGYVPRIIISQPRGGPSIQLSVVKTGPYTAFSHVWSDGLGNTNENSLPTCQILRLKEMTEALPPLRNLDAEYCLPIWIDTLCIPLEPEYRRLALNQLSSVYQGANHVLVLDVDLVRTPYRCSLEEKLVRICLSGWMRRLWTLQEGVLSGSRLKFQFLERAFQLPDPFSAKFLHNPVGRKALSFIHRFVPEKIMYDSSELQSRSEGTDAGEASLLRVSKPAQVASTNITELRRSLDVVSLLVAIQYRSTSKRMDETICLGSLMRLDVSKISVHKSTEQRMMAFVRLMEQASFKVPDYIVFSQEPKLRIPGYRWVPVSFMDISTVDAQLMLKRIQQGGGNFDHKGLYSQFRGYDLHFSSKHLEDYIALDLPGPRISYVVRVSENDSRRNFNRENDSETLDAVFESKRLAIVIPPAEIAQSWSFFGVLVLIYAEDANQDGLSTMLYARLLNSVSLVEYEYQGYRRGRETVAVGALINEQQRWCIG